jgi:hypothetical protein
VASRSGGAAHAVVNKVRQSTAANLFIAHLVAVTRPSSIANLDGAAKFRRAAPMTTVAISFSGHLTTGRYREAGSTGEGAAGGIRAASEASQRAVPVRAAARRAHEETGARREARMAVERRSLLVVAWALLALPGIALLLWLFVRLFAG